MASWARDRGHPIPAGAERLSAHIGHAKSICLNFGVAEEFGGQTYLRFDDTNPLKESEEYAQAIVQRRGLARLSTGETG